MTGELHDGQLHAKAQPEEGDLLFPGVLDGADFAVDAPVAEAAGHQDSAHVPKEPGGIFTGDGLGIHPLDVHRGMIGHTAVL